MNTTGLKSQKILGISITTNSKGEILEYLQKYLLQAQSSSASWRIKAQNERVKPLLVATPNPEQIVYAQGDLHFAEIVNQADVALPDGIGLAFASRIFSFSKLETRNSKLTSRIPGVEFMEDLVKIAAKEGYTIGLIGGREGVAVKALECLQSKYSGLRGWADEGPEIKLKTQKSKLKTETQNSQNQFLEQFNNIAIEQSGKDITDEYMRQVAERINRTKTQLVFVGLGAPKQEYFIEKLKIQNSKFKTEIQNAKDQLQPSKGATFKDVYSNSLVFMSVGGSFDIITGGTPRAPFVLRTIGVEWLWRLFKEPWRWRRQIALVRFMLLVARERLHV